MKKIENVEDRLSTFSKRRSGIYKKINDVILTCNAEVGLLVFTNSETPYTFGHPSIEAMFDKLMNPIHQSAKTRTDSCDEVFKKEHMNHRNEGYELLFDALEHERERRKMLHKISEEKQLKNCWWNTPVEGLNSNDVQQINDAFVELHDALCEEICKRLHQIGEGTSSFQ